MDTRNAVSKQNNLKISIETSNMVGEYISSRMYKPSNNMKEIVSH